MLKTLSIALIVNAQLLSWAFIHSSIHLFIHSFIQHMVPEHLLGAGPVPGDAGDTAGAERPAP